MRILRTSNARTSVVFALAITGTLLTGCTSPQAAVTTENASPITEDWELSPATLDLLYAEKLRNLRVAYGLAHDVEPSLVRYVTAGEIAIVISDCVADAGFVVTPNDQGGVSIDSPPDGQHEALNEAMAKCEAMYPIDPRMNMRLPRLRAEAQYRFLTDTVAPCITDLGYTLPEPPSMQTWLDSYYQTGFAWDPVAIASEQIPPDNGADALDEIYLTCPTISEDVYPPTEFNDQ